MIKFTINNLYTKIEYATYETIELIKERCTYVHNHFYRVKAKEEDVALGRAKKKGDWITVMKPKRYTYYDERNYIFPTGVLYSVLNYLDNYSIIYTFEDRREKPKRVFEKTNTGYELYKHQIPPFKKALKYQRGILNLDTNAGKTIIAMELINELGCQTLYIVPNKTLLYQAYNDFVKSFGKDLVGIIGDGKLQINPIVVATLASLWSKKQIQDIKILLNNIGLLICDETHHIRFSNKSWKQKPWNTYYLMAMRTPNAFYRFGMSATIGKPGTLERGLLECATGRVLNKIQQTELIKQGISAKPYIRMVEYNVLESFSDWREAYEHLIFTNKEYNTMLLETIRFFQKKKKAVAVIIHRTQTHMKLLQEMIPDATFLFGGTSGKKRTEAFRNFVGGKVLIGTIFGEGCNIPQIDVFIIGSGQSSFKLIKQKVGRALRTREDKDSVIIIDFMVSGDKYLHRHSLNRKKYYDSEEGFDFRIVKKNEIFEEFT